MTAPISKMGIIITRRTTSGRNNTNATIAKNVIQMIHMMNENVLTDTPFDNEFYRAGEMGFAR